MNRSVVFYSLLSISQFLLASAVFVRNGPGWTPLISFMIGWGMAAVCRAKWTD